MKRVSDETAYQISDSVSLAVAPYRAQYQLVAEADKSMTSDKLIVAVTALNRFGPSALQAARQQSAKPNFHTPTSIELL